MDPARVQVLESIVGRPFCLSSLPERIVYECDGLMLQPEIPGLVVLPKNRDEVIAIVRCCHQWKIPFVARGAGTGLSGGAIAPPQGIVIDCSRMNRILEVNIQDRFAIVEPGVVNAELSSKVKSSGLFFAPDPSSQRVCTLGGNAAENAGGPHTLKYGATTAHILGLEMVLPNGELLRTGSPYGYSHGFDLTGALVGSEGTLGVFTELTVRLTPLPEGTETLWIGFPDLVSACRAVGKIIRAGLLPAALEVMDQRTVEMIEASVHAAGLPKEAGAVLLAEFDGERTTLQAQAGAIRQLCEEEGALHYSIAENDEERLQFWKARKAAFGAMGRTAPDVYVHDAVVPRSRLPETVEKVCEIADRYSLRLANLLHAGDGNLHPNIAFDRRNSDELHRVLQAGEEILAFCVSVGGTLSGEHGIGREKQNYMSLVFSEEDLHCMERFKKIFDPQNGCNPGKIFPMNRGCVESGPRMQSGREGKE